MSSGTLDDVTALHAASVLYADDAATIAALDQFVALDVDGVRTLDLPALAQRHPLLARSINEYLDLSRKLLEEHRAGVGGAPFVLAEVELVQAFQRDDAEGRADLVEFIESASRIPHLAYLMDEALSTKPDHELIRRRAAAWACHIETTGHKTVITLEVPSTTGWGSCWGGITSPHELRRRITIETNHAAWRDRRARRLVSVRVVADELWADPSAM